MEIKGAIVPRQGMNAAPRKTRESPRTLTKPVVSSPKRSVRAKQSPGCTSNSPFKHASTNLNAATLGLLVGFIFSSICMGVGGRIALYIVIKGVPFRRHLHNDETGSKSSPSSSLSESLK